MKITVTGTTDVAVAPGETGTPRNPFGEKGGAWAPPPRGDEGDDWPPDDSHDSSGDRYRAAMVVGLVVVAITFVSLTSIYILRARLARDWQPLPATPRLLFISTALILAGSFTMRLAGRNLEREQFAAYRRALWATLLLGLGFLGAQFIVWRQLAASGIYLAGHPHSSFFFLLTGAHALHLVGGVCSLYFLLLRSCGEKHSPYPALRRRSLTKSIALYWHFMDGLWVYLFVLLFAWT